MLYTSPMLKFMRHHRYFAVFLLGTALYLLACAPALLYRGGFFYYFGDYVFQTIEFYTSAHQAVTEGYLGWNPNIELGGPMAECYGFYLWGSPFFWLSMLLPTAVVPYALPFIMALRYGTAACTAFLWVRQFTHTDRSALIGALLYAFSGFQAVNIVFSHFHDVTAFFPLFLYLFDRLMQGKPQAKPLFSLGAAFMACLNYYFFFGEVVFLILYFLVRYYTWRPAETRTIVRELRARRKLLPRAQRGHLLQRDRAGRLASRISCELERYDQKTAACEYARCTRNGQLFVRALTYGCLGIMLAAFFLVQTVVGVIGNSRLLDRIGGDGLLAFNEPTTVWSILKSVFFVPELMGRQSLFNNPEIQWASVSLYLPCLGPAGIIAYVLHTRSKRIKLSADWKICLIVILSAMTLIPGLSALFSALNATFYARWYYLPILVGAAMTAEALEEASLAVLRRSAKVVIVITLAFLMFGFLPGREQPLLGGLLSLPGNATYYVLIVLSTLAMLVFLWLLFFNRRSYTLGTKPSGKTLVTTIAFCCVLSTGCVLIDGCLVYSNDEAKNFETQCLQQVPAVDERFYARIETDDSAQNWALIWGLPTNRSFLSTPAASTFDIYDAFEERRIQESNIKMSHVGLRHLLSTRYYLHNIAKKKVVDLLNPLEDNSDLNGEVGIGSVYMDSDNDDSRGAGIPLGYNYTKDSDGFSIYETDHFIPMGFTFDTYMTESDYLYLRDEAYLPASTADRLLVKDLILTDHQAQQYGHLFARDHVPKQAITLDECFAACDARAKSACTNFAPDPSGYTAQITLDQENLVFFSIPWDRGFTAFVDGEPAALEKVDYGFIAVDVPAGTHEIRLIWKPWGMTVGAGISVASLLILVILACYEAYKRHRCGTPAQDTQRDD